VLRPAPVLAPAPTPIRSTTAQDRPLAANRARAWWRRLVPALLGVALVAAGVFGLQRWQSSERSIEAARLRVAETTRGTLVRDAAVTGRVVAAVSPTIYAPVAGTITLSIRAGDTVAEGDVVATIASPELESQLRSERSTLEQLEAQLGSAKIGSSRQRLTAEREADEAEIAFTAATRELQSLQHAFELGAVPELDLLRAQDAVKTAKIRHANAKKAAELAGRSASFDLQTVRKQHEHQSLAVVELERRIGELVVRAPVGGVVGTLSVTERAVVAANTALMTIVDLGQLEVELQVPETYVDDLGLGMTVELSIGPTKAAAMLSVLSPEVVDHHVLARARFTGEQPAGLRQSQRVTARILIDERPDVVMVPRGPFMEAHGGLHIYVIEDGLAVRRPVRIGTTAVAAVEILEGLEPGERVVIAGSETFEDAETIRILD
jgi:HlyD family secretion protein